MKYCPPDRASFIHPISAQRRNCISLYLTPGAFHPISMQSHFTLSNVGRISPNLLRRAFDQGFVWWEKATGRNQIIDLYASRFFEIDRGAQV